MNYINYFLVDSKDCCFLFQPIISPYSVRMRENADQNNSKTDTFYVVIYSPIANFISHWVDLHSIRVVLTLSWCKFESYRFLYDGESVMKKSKCFVYCSFQGVLNLNCLMFPLTTNSLLKAWVYYWVTVFSWKEY